MADKIFDELLYRGHPYARSEDGNPETIKAITRADLVKFHQKTFGPRGMTIAVVGAVEPKRVIELIDRALGDWKNVDQPGLPLLPDLKFFKGSRKKHYKIAGKSQADIVIGTNGPGEMMMITWLPICVTQFLVSLA